MRKTRVFFLVRAVKLARRSLSARRFWRGAKEARGDRAVATAIQGVRNIYLPDNARALNEAGLCRPQFRLQGMGAIARDQRPGSRPTGRLADVQAGTDLSRRATGKLRRTGSASTAQAMAGAHRGGGAAAIDPRVKMHGFSVVGHRQRRRAGCAGVRRPRRKYYDLLERAAAADRTRRALEGASEFCRTRRDPAARPASSAELGHGGPPQQPGGGHHDPARIRRRHVELQPRMGGR